MAVYQCSEMLSRVPFVVILGATGSGKSKLAIQLARKYGGEIVSADSMQVYKGLDIITNKVTAEERAMAPHHLLEVVPPLEPFSVVDFRDAALPIIDRLISEKKMPIIVGGTNYYIESLLWKVLLNSGDLRKRPAAEDDHDGDDDDNDDDLTELIAKRRRGSTEPETLRGVPSAQLHQRLMDVDPEMAQRLHPNNRRKVIRSLQVFAQLGRTMSSVLEEQRSEEGGSSLGGPLRYPHSLILWIQCDKKVLDRRLDERVDEMLERGLVDELLAFHEEYNACRPKADYTEGIFQSIGFKEFHEYLVLDAEARASERGRQLLEKGVAALKMVTRRYARKQLRWVHNRFLRRPDRQLPPVYALDATDVEQWDKLVYEPAASIVESFVQGTETDYKPLPVEAALENEEKSNFCEVCGRTFVGTLQWQSHLASLKHKRMLNKTKKEKNSKGKEDKCGTKSLVESSDENATANQSLKQGSE